jgi:hypothetical protein
MIRQGEGQKRSPGTGAESGAGTGAVAGDATGYGPWVRSVARTVTALRHSRRTLASRPAPARPDLDAAAQTTAAQTPVPSKASALRSLAAMPMNFLRRIENATFPLTIHDDFDIQCAAVLAEASLVEANLPAVDLTASATIAAPAATISASSIKPLRVWPMRAMARLRPASVR